MEVLCGFLQSRGGDLSRKIEVAANTATIAVAVLLSVVLIKTYLLPNSVIRRAAPARTADVVAVGANLSKRVPDVSWNRSGPTLVLALSTHCHFCTESAPFFRRIRESAGKDVRVIAVLPEAVADAQAYLNREGVHVDEVKQISLSKVGVTGTPTMLLVTKKGIVAQTWVGKLAPDKQDQALKLISGGRSPGLKASVALAPTP